jgi:LPS-assembly protein
MVELRWPLVRRDAGSDHLVEPIVQLVYAEAIGDEEPPNEDSALPELSHANLFTRDRLPGRDRVETGLRANLGVQYLRDDPDGWSLGLTLGRVLRASDEAQFPEGAGLGGRASDYVGEATLDFAWGLGVANRFVTGSDLEFTRNEFSVAYEGPSGALGASYVYLAEDDSNRFLGPQPETSELALAARYRVLPNWELRGSWRYDVTGGENLRAGGGVTYGNECAEIDLSVSRRYTSSDNLPPVTRIGFGLRLAGLGASGTRSWPARVCAAAARG